MIIDTNSNCLHQVEFLANRGVEAVGRYYTTTHPTYALTRPEALALSAAGIRIFTVFENYGGGTQIALTADRGKADAQIAMQQAGAVGQPNGTTIYFALEGLPDGYGHNAIAGVMSYFGGVRAALANKFTAGVYGDGIVCKSLLDAGVCSRTWLAQAAYSFEGTSDFYKSKRWTLAQILGDLPPEQWKGLSVDVNEALGDIGAFLVPAQ